MVLSESLFAYVMLLYLTAEVIFVFIYIFVFLPKANQLNPHPPDYRDYGRDRKKLLLRILTRIEDTCQYDGSNTKETIVSFLANWFHTVRDSTAVPTLSRSASSQSNTDDDEDQCLPKCQLYKEDLDTFFSWAFFAKHYAAMLPVRCLVFYGMHGPLRSDCDLTFLRTSFGSFYIFSGN